MKEGRGRKMEIEKKGKGDKKDRRRKRGKEKWAQERK